MVRRSHGNAECISLDQATAEHQFFGKPCGGKILLLFSNGRVIHQVFVIEYDLKQTRGDSDGRESA
jgi:hypothetical protein